MLVVFRPYIEAYLERFYFFLLGNIIILYNEREIMFFFCSFPHIRTDWISSLKDKRKILFKFPNFNSAFNEVFVYTMNDGMNIMLQLRNFKIEHELIVQCQSIQITTKLYQFRYKPV